MKTLTALRRSLHPNAGQTLLAVLVLMVLVAGWSSTFIWFMNQEQTRAGIRFRSAAAMAVAEAGAHKALSILESVAPDGRSPGRAWRPSGYSETLLVGSLEGQFTLSLTDESDGAILIDSIGDLAGVTRHLRARVYLASPTLLTALHVASTIRFQDHPATLVILPYGAGFGDRPWTHIAAGREVWFSTTDVSINDPSAPVDVGAGPVDTPDSVNDAGPAPLPGPVRVLLARVAELRAGKNRQRVDLDLLRTMGVSIQGSVTRTDPFPRVPEPDGTFYRTAAVGNASNTALNEAAGQYFHDATLARKRDSVYSPEQFTRLQQYAKTLRRPPVLQGIIYVSGGISLGEGEELEILDGALITESTVQVGKAAGLSILHTARTRALPGIIALSNSALTIAEKARLRVHGLLYASRTFEVGQDARVDVVGAILDKDQDLGFKNHGGAVVIRYDPAVLGTPGLHVPDDLPVVAWVAMWQELP